VLYPQPRTLGRLPPEQVLKRFTFLEGQSRPPYA